MNIPDEAMDNKGVSFTLEPEAGEWVWRQCGLFLRSFETRDEALDWFRSLCDAAPSSPIDAEQP